MQSTSNYPLFSSLTPAGSVSTVLSAMSCPASCCCSAPGLSDADPKLARKAGKSAGSNRGCPLALACLSSSALAALICNKVTHVVALRGLRLTYGICNLSFGKSLSEFPYLGCSVSCKDVTYIQRQLEHHICRGLYTLQQASVESP